MEAVENISEIFELFEDTGSSLWAFSEALLERSNNIVHDDMEYDEKNFGTVLSKDFFNEKHEIEFNIVHHVLSEIHLTENDNELIKELKDLVNRYNLMCDYIASLLKINIKF